ncbi:luciferase [Pseudonocardia sulfidoxydans NBRC 16205]|uniref:Luciferase n=2 Tax=Pseudonocardia sulfidoxydans TaxID=54011 RepID=A0A511DJR3_9PSEU|nr:LLM class flavin-dependent oxidoreductase [Pseudonocardia sulfidoxydans]GEL25045.1 luciferase [Pseudonocardia sulfidoxydans NBRC 16205]
MAMKFGLACVSFQKHPDDERSFEQIYDDLLDLAVLAEQVGFDSFWLSEHHGVPDGWLPSLMPVAAAIAARTTSLRIGTGIAVAPFYDPIRLAEDAAVLDILSKGRFDLGLAVGYRQEEFETFGVKRSERGGRLDEIVEILRAAWRGPVDHHGKYYSYDGVDVTPKPGSKTVPIYLGGIAEEAVMRAARGADGFLSSGTSDFETLAERIDKVRAAGARDDLDVCVTKYCFVDRDGDAWGKYKKSYDYIHRLYVALTSGELEGLYSASSDDAAIRESLQQEAAILGTPAEVYEQIRRMQDRIGDFHFHPRMWLPGIGRKEAETAIRTFGDDVISRFR